MIDMHSFTAKEMEQLPLNQLQAATNVLYTDTGLRIPLRPKIRTSCKHEDCSLPVIEGASLSFPYF